MPRITISSDLDRQRAAERIEDLTGCLEGSAEERELIDLVLALEVWDTKHRIG